MTSSDQSSWSMLAEPLRAITDAIGRSTAGLPDNYLAYLALTSKPELQIRDVLAWSLYQELTPDFVVAREWTPSGGPGGGRTDLAIVTPDGSPVVLLEAKSFMTFDAVIARNLDRYLTYLEKDRDKARTISSDAALILLLISAHVADGVPPHLDRVVKYRSAINRSLRVRTATDLANEAHRTIVNRLRKFGSVEAIPLGHGKAFDVPCEINAYAILCI